MKRCHRVSMQSACKKLKIILSGQRSPGQHRFRRGGSLVPHTYVDLWLCFVKGITSKATVFKSDINKSDIRLVELFDANHLLLYVGLCFSASISGRLSALACLCYTTKRPSRFCTTYTTMQKLRQPQLCLTAASFKISIQLLSIF